MRESSTKKTEQQPFLQLELEKSEWPPAPPPPPKEEPKEERGVWEINLVR
jgi:hypothetical protein